ncbi:MULTISPECIES: tetratricopeptide repeat-containing sensor histidine kinase [unclassified Tenacibaculum]|uniref:tetratricopeptide repeat-containing sensor histidine kinase n=1 Tax=unclassified Tenacibaculum TaxID=2635139 RepID=UPI001F34C49C|nr:MULTISPECIES: tetratricopeptide repeat-containing sensor histidine kinase [unclassified Tenacibaculum]MCF2873094.1 tetratricopeptide repeat-containing sensor histidine kinase [Tenacibaculum sp. Cn5-1]MCF2933250.1 tetratricopeptide repeat-containing sensor histidine kinase [Tenacibaculum sp. Cn5-34]MCG7510169.1 tetratricopeptide repeat-containing sensor histidine kinase [Tenacibaculum sp. Cn5-46]
MHILRTILVLLFTVHLFSQQKDELSVEFEKIIEKHQQKEDLKRIHTFFKEKEWDSTLIHSYVLLKDTKDKKLLNYIHFLRARSFKKKNVLDQSLKEYQLISNVFPFYPYTKGAIGQIYLLQNKYKKALKIFLDLEKNYFNIKHKPQQSAILHNIGLCYFHLSKFKEAEKYLLNSTSLQEKKKDTILLIGSYMDIANVYYEQYKDNEAIPFFKKAYELSKKTSNFKIKRKAALNMAVVEENRKDLAKALVYRKEFEKWKDSINNQNRIWAVAQVEKKLAVAQKQKQINLLEAENKLKASQRNGFFISSILLILLLTSGLFLYSQKSKANKIITTQKEELNQLNKTKDKLFSIVSHDLRSSVNLLKKSNSNLLTEIKNRNYDALGNIVNKNAAIANSSYNLLENLLNWSTMQTKQIYFNIESVDLFSIMQQVAFNYQPLFDTKNITFINKVTPATFIYADIDSLKIIIRNLLDNAIKFSNENDTIIIYNFSIKNNLESLVIEDTGIGMSEETVKDLLKDTTLLNKKRNQEEIGTGLGIHLCKTLIEKNNAQFKIESIKDMGTKMIISFPKSN